MSGVMPPNDPWPMESAPPQALAELARALEDAGPSPHVERALDAAWEALHGTTARHHGPAARPWSVWVWPGLGAAAALVVAALWVGWPLPGRGAPEQPEPVGLEAAVPGGPIEPPPPRQPAAAGPSVRTGEAVGGGTVAPAPSSTPAAPRPTARPDAARIVRARPAQAVARDEPEPFFWIRGADDIEPGLGVHLVRVQVPRLRWDEGTPSRELVDADVLMGNDGQARAVRVVRTGSR